MGEEEPATAGRAPDRSLKRALFPSTLWEAGARPRRAFGSHADRVKPDRSSILVLHTTYLAGLAGAAPDRGRCAVDVYDLVWRAHAHDAIAAAAPLRFLRRTYSALVRPREERALEVVGAVLVAGYEDHGLLRTRIPAARWIPTATPVEASARGERDEAPLRVGMLGNFNHASTVDSARLLLGAPLASEPGVSVVIAGIGSETAFGPRPGLELLGPRRRAEDFYAGVDCVVAPVGLGSGVKCKLGEALLAGRPVVTTTLGLAGYPPALRELMTTADPARLDGRVVRETIARFDPAQARERAEAQLGWDRVVDLYAEAAADLIAGPPVAAQPRASRSTIRRH